MKSLILMLAISAASAMTHATETALKVPRPTTERSAGPGGGVGPHPPLADVPMNLHTGNAESPNDKFSVRAFCKLDMQFLAVSRNRETTFVQVNGDDGKPMKCKAR